MEGKTVKPSHHDRISSLPDEILVMILSQLPITQSAQTSTLSRRWKTLWTSTTAINFDSADIPKNSQRPPSFINCLNQALDSHRAITLNRLRIRMRSSWGDRSESDFSGWMDFAVKKSVQEFECEFQYSKKPFESNNPSFPVLGFSNFSSLKTLSLRHAGVGAKHVEHFLCHCPNLEALCLSDLGCVRNLNISSASLISLEISRCFSLRSLLISAANLVSFAYWGPDRKIVLEQAPLLAEVSFHEAYCLSLARYKFKHLAGVLPQLQTLKLALSYPWFTRFPNVDGLRNLKKLELKVKVWGSNHAFTLCTSSINALPFLQKFSLHLFRSRREHEDDDDDGEPSDDDNHRHHGLKVVEFAGFVGWLLDFQIIRFVVNNAVSLEKVTIRPCRLDLIHSDRDFMKIEEREEARKLAHLLREELSPYTHLVVL